MLAAITENFAFPSVRSLFVSIKTSNTSTPCSLVLVSLFTLGTNSIPGYLTDNWLWRIGSVKSLSKRPTFTELSLYASVSVGIVTELFTLLLFSSDFNWVILDFLLSKGFSEVIVVLVLGVVPGVTLGILGLLPGVTLGLFPGFIGRLLAPPPPPPPPPQLTNKIEDKAINIILLFKISFFIF